VPRFTVNVSGQTLEDPDFLSYVAAAIDKYRIASSTLLFEIDESDVLARLQAAARFANAAKALGCGVLVDGFGRRAVSFEPLKVLRVDFVKVDGTIVRKLLKSEVAHTKLNAILRVAEALRIGVVAENVEEQDILGKLRALNVSHAQGFGVYKPEPIDSWMKS
jgi:EAL domain-containing protein (putative c-di-GMP-specific phosphodiesterase class I)